MGFLTLLREGKLRFVKSSSLGSFFYFLHQNKEKEEYVLTEMPMMKMPPTQLLTSDFQLHCCVHDEDFAIEPTRFSSFKSYAEVRKLIALNFSGTLFSDEACVSYELCPELTPTIPPNEIMDNTKCGRQCLRLPHVFKLATGKSIDKCRFILHDFGAFVKKNVRPSEKVYVDDIQVPINFYDPVQFIEIVLLSKRFEKEYDLNLGEYFTVIHRD